LLDLAAQTSRLSSPVAWFYHVLQSIDSVPGLVIEIGEKATQEKMFAALSGFRDWD
jgi:hypothetical protein